MKTVSELLLACFVLSLFALTSPLRADEKRIAFVVGNASYQAGPLATPANDAGLIAQTLQAAGFDVAGARDLDGESLRAAFRDFLDKAQASGPDTVAFLYLGGYGAQLDGENYFVPVDAKIAAATDVAVEALRVSDYTKRLAGLSLKASFVVLDDARVSPFAKSGQPLAGGLALVDAEPNMLVAFNAAPGTAAPAEGGPYGAYARALAEMIREGGLSPSEVFEGVRLRVNETTKGAQVPWDASRIAAPFVFFERAQNAPPPALAPDQVNAMRARPLRDFGAPDAYAAAIERDTLQGYEEFLAAYPTGPLANRIRALVAARREAMTWRRTCLVNTPDAYWSYLNRYPRGPHSPGARRRLSTLAAPEEPPHSFSAIIYDVPPPPPAEIVYIDRPVLVFDDPAFDFAPPPPIVFLAPPPPYLIFLPPPPPLALFVLPVPIFVPVPVWINPPAYVAPPPENVIFNNIHNATIINNNTTIVNPDRVNVPLSPGLPAAVGVGAGAAAAIAAKVALPPSVAQKAATIGDRHPGPPGMNSGQPMSGAPLGQPGPMPSTRLAPGDALPGANGKPLPRPGGQPAAQTQQKPQPALPGGPRPTPGASSQNDLSAAHALPSGHQLPPLPGGHVAPGDARHGRATPPGAHLSPEQQLLKKPPVGQVPPQNGFAPSRPNGKPVVTGPTSTIVPKLQQPQQPPRQFQQWRQPQPAYQPPHAPQQPQQWRQPQPAYQPPRAPQQPQQSRPPQQQRGCGLPGLPPCH
ncbi:caspase family protein (plasmid) [Methylocapsa polymorpha]|uniref:Caspase family protein n=1 Tax=Methylocapsa polymorpha TaxID=3080828 RepID=A0ABZ0HX56_9HYPH|nr:caspase family protein [Methylocapsa sp. RX1]